MLKNKIIIVAGANGRIGSALCAEILRQNGLPILADITENSEFKANLEAKFSKNLQEFVQNFSQTQNFSPNSTQNLGKNQKITTNLAQNSNKKISANLTQFSTKNAQNSKQKKQKIPANLMSVKMDICDKKSLQNAINSVLQIYGRIDGFVNSAYPMAKSHEQKPYYELDYSEICEALNVHLGGFILASQEFVKFFKRQNYGNIVNLSSIMGVFAPKFENYKGTNMQSSLEYSIIKAGINHMGRWLAKELFGSGVRVNTLASGGILDAQPQVFLNAYKKCCASKGMLDAKDVCGAIAFLLSDLSAFINGQVILVDDGWGL